MQEAHHHPYIIKTRSCTKDLLCARKTMNIWKDKSGKKIGFKEFMSRWKQGMEGITPLQQCKSVQTGTYIIVVGVVWGIIYSVIAKSYWLSCILVGALIINIFGLLGNWQKIRALKKMELAMMQSDLPIAKPDYVA